MTKLRALLMLSIFLVQLDLHAQQDTQLQNYLPPSPTAQEFIKYGEHPVSMYTGLVDISIPIYSINAGNLTIPVGFSYHSSGIKVDQESSIIGLGWTLQAGGSISSVPRGRPDLSSKGYLNSNIPEKEDLNYDNNPDFWEDAAIGLQDTESDVYYFNFNGISGKFFFDRNKNIRIINQSTGLQINYTNNNFEIITENGIVYKFSVLEATESYTSSEGNPLSNPMNYTSTWHLSKITMPNGIDEVNFYYDSYGAAFQSQIYNYSEVTGDKPVIGNKPCPTGGGSTPYVYIQSNAHDFASMVSQTTMTYNPKRLNSITWSNGKIVFNRIYDRQDRIRDRLDNIKLYSRSGNSYSLIKSFKLNQNYFVSSIQNAFPVDDQILKKRLKLVSLDIKDAENDKIKSYEFGYNNLSLPPLEANAKDYWGYYNGSNSNRSLIPKQDYTYMGNSIGNADREPNETYIKAGVLNKIIYPTGGRSEFEYEPHTYKGKEKVVNTKSYDVFAVGQENVIGSGTAYEDYVQFTPTYSGYATISFEGSDMNQTMGVFPTLTLKAVGSSSYEVHHSISPSYYSYPMNPPETEGTLNPVWLAAGTTYIFKAEVNGTSNSNEFDGAAYIKAKLKLKEELSDGQTVDKIAGGLRISKVKSYEKDNHISLIKEYEYSGSKLITPETFLYDQYVENQIQLSVANCTFGCTANSATRKFYYGGTVQSLSLQGGSPVVYRKVIEYTKNTAGNDLGKKEYYYSVHSDVVLPVPYQYNGGVMLLDRSWMGGLNKKQSSFRKNGSNYDLVESNTLNYDFRNYDESYKMYKIGHIMRYTGSCYLAKQSRYQVFEYPIYQGSNLVSEKIKTSFYQNDSVVSYKTFNYDNPNIFQPTKITSVNSYEDVEEDHFYYPHDLEGQEQSTAISNLISNNRISEVIKSEHYYNGEKTAERHAKYGLFSNQALVAKQFFRKGSGNIDLNDDDDLRLAYHSYDSYGNPLKVSKADGPHIFYLWGYHGQYPIAKIENTTEAALESELGLLKNVNDSDLQSINNLRSNSAFKEAMITTFTYKPLVGMTVMTDPRGRTTTYEYDDFGRLEIVKDHEGKLLEEYQYHYKSE